MTTIFFFFIIPEPVGFLIIHEKKASLDCHGKKKHFIHFLPGTKVLTELLVKKCVKENSSGFNLAAPHTMF